MSTFEKLRQNVADDQVDDAKCPMEEYATFDLHDSTKSWYQWSRAYESLRDQCPIGWSEQYGGHWVVTGYPEVMEIIDNPEVFSSSQIIIPAFPKAEKMVPIEVDPPDHMKYRKILARVFSPRMVTGLHEKRIHRRVNELIDSFIEDGHTDAFESIAIPLPAFMTTTILDLPAEDEPRLADWVYKMTHVAAKDPEVGGQAAQAIYGYFGEKLAERRANTDGEDMLSILLRADMDGDQLTEQELLGFCLLLLLASMETTQKVIGSMLWQLGTDPDLRRDIAGHPEIIPSAVEEFLRYWASSEPARVVTKDVTVGGVDMKAGDHVLMLLIAANRDSREFPNGTTFDPRREANRHFTFGSNVHRCLGAHIARLELEILLGEFLRRVPEFEVADQAVVKYAASQGHGIISVPLTFPRGTRELASELS